MATPVTLKVYRGEELVRTERFTRDIIKIGRLSSAHLCLEDDRISRIHSVIEIGADGQISIIDMGSAEGTFLNGKRVSKGTLRHGDEIKLGGLRIVLEGEGNVAVAPVNRALDVPLATPPPTGQNGHSQSNGHQVHLNGAAHVEAHDLPRPAVATAAVAASGAAVAAANVAVAVAAAPVPVAAPQEVVRQRRPAMALARPVDEEPVEAGAPDVGVELRVIWGDTLLDAGTFVAPKQPVLVGEGARCHFRLSGPDLPVAAFPILRHEAGEYRFLFVRSMNGGVQESAKAALRTFAELVKSREATPDDGIEGAYSVPVPRAGAVRAEIGSGLRIEACFKRPPKPAVVPWWEKIDHRYLNLLLLLLFLQGAFIVAAKTTTRDVDLVQDDLAKGQQRMAKFVMRPPEEQPKRNKYLEKLQNDLRKQQPGEMAERHKGDEGQMGKRDAPKTNGRSAPRAIDPNAKELVKNSGLLAALGRGKGAGGLRRCSDRAAWAATSRAPSATCTARWSETAPAWAASASRAPEPEAEAPARPSESAPSGRRAAVAGSADTAPAWAASDRSGIGTSPSRPARPRCSAPSIPSSFARSSATTPTRCAIATSSSSRSIPS